MGAEGLSSSHGQAIHYINTIYVPRGGGARRTKLVASGTTRLLLMQLIFSLPYQG